MGTVAIAGIDTRSRTGILADGAGPRKRLGGHHTRPPGTGLEMGLRTGAFARSGALPVNTGGGPRRGLPPRHEHDRRIAADQGRFGPLPIQRAEAGAVTRAPGDGPAPALTANR